MEFFFVLNNLVVTEIISSTEEDGSVSPVPCCNSYRHFASRL